MKIFRSVSFLAAVLTAFAPLAFADSISLPISSTGSSSRSALGSIHFNTIFSTDRDGPATSDVTTSAPGFVALNGISSITETDPIVDQVGIVNGSQTAGLSNVVSMVAPEPNSFILLGTGLLGMAAFALRRRRTAELACRA